MSWQLGAFAILFLGLAAGFAWYERARPDARMLALVATLAAFAALGRIAFAALPNVKPTTDIVLISGYALGPAPGFVVGALAALTSNFFFGQGPWTPWQMAGWGATGLIGAGLAVGGRRIGRWPLALACLVVGFAFTAFQDVGDWVNYSDHSLPQLGVYVGKGIGFDAVHAVGCVLFALALGPALARSVRRLASRLQVTWRTQEGLGALILLAITAGVIVAGGVPGAGAARAAVSPGSAVGPARYLLSAQNPDGGFGPSPGQPSTELYSGWAALGLAAEGHNPAQVAKHGHSLVDYLQASMGAASDPGSLERTILAAAAAGVDPRSFGGRDLTTGLNAAIGRNGSVSHQTNLTAFAVLALRAAGMAPAARTLHWLVAQQDRDGGFNFATKGGASDVDDTGAVLEALAADRSPAAGLARRRGVTFIRRQQNHDGGFAAFPGAGSNAQSTAWAVQGLLAVGVDPSGLHRMGSPSPLAYLESLVASDGHIRYDRSSDQTPVWVTAQAAMALAGKPLPLKTVPRSRAAPRHHRRTVKPRAKVVRSAPPRRVTRRRQNLAVPAATTAKLATDAGILDALVLAPLGIG